MEKVKELISHTKKIRIRKIHIDYLVGLLSLPVLISAILINIINLRSKNTTPVISPTQIPLQEKNVNATVQVCKKTVGPVTITYPQEGQVITDNPVCFIIDYSDQNYCSVVWSYRVNNGSWSDYNTNAPCLYNLPEGNTTFQIRVNSTVSPSTKILTRNFTYNGVTTLSTPAPTIINSPNPTPATPTTSATPTSSPTPTIMPTVSVGSGSAH